MPEGNDLSFRDFENETETKKRIGHKIFQPEAPGIGYSRRHMLYLKAQKLDDHPISTHV